MSEFKTTEGHEVYEAKDGSTLPPEQGWIAALTNPFHHACCDCSLVHTVEFGLVDGEGNEIPFPEGAFLALRFSRDEIETLNLRLQKCK